MSVRNGGEMNIDDGGTLNVDGNLDVDGGTINVDGGLLEIGGILDIAGGAINTLGAGRVRFPATTMVHSGGRIDASGGADVDLTGRYLDVSGAFSAAAVKLGGSVVGTRTNIVVNWTGATFSVRQTKLEAIGVGDGNDSIAILNATADLGEIIVSTDPATAGLTTVTISNGATVTTDDVMVHPVAGGETLDVTILVTGDGTTMTQNAGSDFHLGRMTGLAELRVTDGAVFTNTGLISLTNDDRIVIDGGAAHLGILSTSLGGSVDFQSGVLSYVGELRVGSNQLFGQYLVLTTHDLALTGITTVEPVGELIIAGGSLTTAALEINGAFQFDSGTLRLTGDSGLSVSPGGMLGDGIDLEADQALHIDATTTIVSGSRINVNGGVLTSGLIVVQENGSIGVGPGGFTNTSEIQLGGLSSRIDGGVLTNRGPIHGTGRIQSTLINEAGGELRAGVGQWLVVTGAGNSNAGDINLIGGSVEFTQDLTNHDSGRIVGWGNLVAGALTNFGIIQLTADSGVLGVVTNDAGGGIGISGESTATFFDDIVHNGDEIHVDDGSAAVFFGMVSGAGSFTGEGLKFFEGGYSPGNSPALVDVEGDVGFGASNTLVMELAGRFPGKEYDVLDISGTVTLDGLLEIDLLTDFLPDPGDHFDVLSAATMPGQFDAVSLPSIAGIQWQLDYILNPASTDTLRLTAVNVPSPPAATLFVIGLLA